MRSILKKSILISLWLLNIKAPILRHLEVGLLAIHWAFSSVVNLRSEMHYTTDNKDTLHYSMHRLGRKDVKYKKILRALRQFFKQRLLSYNYINKVKDLRMKYEQIKLAAFKMWQEEGLNQISPRMAFYTGISP